jgi:hypothetical protein
VTDRGGGFPERAQRLYNYLGWVWRYRIKRLHRNDRTADIAERRWSG